MSVGTEHKMKLTEEILRFSRYIASSCPIVAVFERTDVAWPVNKGVATPQIIVILQNFQPRLMNYVKVFDSTNISVLAVDEWVFERDIDRGFLGESLAGGLVFPYRAIQNSEYLHMQEVKLKKRLIVEILQRLVSNYPELSQELHIGPQYFMYEAMLARGRLFPPTLYAFISLMRKGPKNGGYVSTLDGFLKALGELQIENVVSYSENYVKISKHFAEKSKRFTIRFVDPVRTGQRALFTSLLGVFPQILSVFSQDRKFLSRLSRALSENSMKQEIEDPENYVYIPTSTGLVPLSNRFEIETAARRVLSVGKDVGVSIKNIGGILNDVYLIEAMSQGKHSKVVVKRFRDWSNFKWFPLTLWSIGTRSFAVLGTSRLERECGINRFLDTKGFSVPRILHVSSNKRLIVMEYVDGESLSEVVKRITSSGTSRADKKDMDSVAQTGRVFAEVHALEVALGDTKPENILVGTHPQEGRIYLMDFEQASRRGDKVWDVAEFLYYSGHDISPFADMGKLEQFVWTFVKAYLEVGGDRKVIKKAAGPKYTKVFSVFTFPHIIFTISNICRKADKLRV